MLYSPLLSLVHTHTHTPHAHIHTPHTHTPTHTPHHALPSPFFPSYRRCGQAEGPTGPLHIREGRATTDTRDCTERSRDAHEQRLWCRWHGRWVWYTNIKNARTVLHNFMWSQQFSLNGIIFSCSWGCRKFLKLQSPPKPSIVTTVGMWMHSGSRLQSTLQGEQPLLPHMYICLIDTGTDCVYCTVQVVSQWRPSRRWRGREMTSGKCWKIRYVQ